MGINFNASIYYDDYTEYSMNDVYFIFVRAICLIHFIIGIFNYTYSNISIGINDDNNIICIITF